MFTGLIEATCRVRSLTPSGGGTAALAVELGPIAAEAAVGDSIAINGVCLTVTRIDGAFGSFDVSGETLDRSSIGRLKPGSLVNIERALQLGDRLGGHIVQGHIDGTAAIRSIEKTNAYANITFTAEKDLLEQMVVKGSVAVDGISLTVAGLDDKGFGVAVIPETMRKTTLQAAKSGDTVNIETDIIVKTVKRHLANILPASGGLTVDKLRQMGF